MQWYGMLWSMCAAAAAAPPPPPPTHCLAAPALITLNTALTSKMVFFGEAWDQHTQPANQPVRRRLAPPLLHQPHSSGPGQERRMWRWQPMSELRMTAVASAKAAACGTLCRSAPNHPPKRHVGRSGMSEAGKSWT